MTADQISVLLGRPLSATETANFTTYKSLAYARVADLICSSIESEIEEPKTFELKDGYRTLNTPIFNNLVSIKVDGNELDEADYKVKQGSSFNGDWFNTIVFDTTQNCKTVEVTADWGFYPSIPLDLQKLVAEQFGIASSMLDADQISRKQVEDFSIQYAETKSDAFAKKYAPTIAKYSCCDGVNLQSGKVYGRYYEYGRFYSL